MRWRENVLYSLYLRSSKRITEKQINKILDYEDIEKGQSGQISYDI